MRIIISSLTDYGMMLYFSSFCFLSIIFKRRLTLNSFGCYNYWDNPIIFQILKKNNFLKFAFWAINLFPCFVILFFQLKGIWKQSSIHLSFSQIREHAEREIIVTCFRCDFLEQKNLLLLEIPWTNNWIEKKATFWSDEIVLRRQ